MNPIVYHQEILECVDYSNHPYVLTCKKMLPDVQKAVETVIIGGHWEKYCSSIEEYDKYMWERYHEKPQKSNPINITQNKKYSSWRELMLYPLWARIKSQIKFPTEIILNKPVTQTIYSDGSIQTKDVDGGLGIYCNHNNTKLFLPVLTDEDKGGHFCKTTASNVEGINRKFKDLNPNIITTITTDNHITMGQDIDTEFFKSTDILLSVRGKNGEDPKKYSKLEYKRFETIEKVIIEKLNSMSISDFTCEKINIREKEKKTVREFIDKQGFLIKF